MASRDDVLRDLVQRVKALEETVERLANTDGWDLDFNVDAERVWIPEGTEPPPVEEAPSKPKDWHLMNADQREAWIRVQVDTAKPIDLAPKAETHTIEIAGGIGAEFPKPDEAAKEAWALSAEAIMEHFMPDKDKGTLIAHHDAVRSYREGGPLWLAAFDHEYLMSLPNGWRVAMVEQVLAYAPTDGTQLARDILRVDTDKQQAAAYSDLEAQRNRG